MPQEWTDEQTNTVIEMLKQGFSAGQISDALGRSKNSVIGKIDRGALWRFRPEKVQRKPTRRMTFKKKAAEEPFPPDPDRGPHNKTMLRVGPEDCHWPVGDPRDPDFVFCGAPAAPDKPYCARHWTRATDRSKDKELKAEPSSNQQRTWEIFYGTQSQDR